MKRTQARLLWGLLPGLLLCGGLVLYATRLTPRTYEVPALAADWTEPQAPAGRFKSFRQEEGHLIGETEPWPHKHPRANSYLLSKATYVGDVAVTVRFRLIRGHFPNSRYVGCYLDYDPKTGNGYWLSTGHAVGKYPNKAYVKIVRQTKWETIARGDFPLEADRVYEVVYSRKGDELAVTIDGKRAVSATIPPADRFGQGHVQLRLHNTEVEILSLEVNGEKASVANETSPESL